MSLPSRLLCSLAAVSSLVLAPMILARGGPLRQPTLGLPDSFPGRPEVHAVISDSSFRYLGGAFLNGSASLRYGGDTAALNRFLARLAACRGVRLQVSFAEDPSDATWTLTHDNARDVSAFEVSVNLRRAARAAVKVPRA